MYLFRVLYAHNAKGQIHVQGMLQTGVVHCFLSILPFSLPLRQLLWTLSWLLRYFSFFPKQVNWTFFDLWVWGIAYWLPIMAYEKLAIIYWTLCALPPQSLTLASLPPPFPHIIWVLLFHNCIRSLPGAHWASWICKFMSLTMFGKVWAIISLNIYSPPIFLLNMTPIIYMLGFLIISWSCVHLFFSIYFLVVWLLVM